MSQFVFSNTTTVYFGKDKLRNIRNEIQHYGNNILIVSGGMSSEKSGALSALLEQINDIQAEITRFKGITANPSKAIVNEGIKLCRDKKINLIIAVGGGSVLDSAKAIAAGVNSDTDDIWDIVTNKKSIRDPLPVITVPTTAATGSEMNAGAVITDPVNKVKTGFGHPSLQPAAAFCVPEFTVSLPPYQTACGCADIISHIIDSAYISKHKPMFMLHEVQTQILRTVFHYAPAVMRHPDNIEARENIMWASAWALNGFMYENLKQDPVIHIMEHQLSAEYDITHGHGIAIILPRWLRYILSDETAGIIADFGKDCMELIPSGNTMRDAENTISSLENFLSVTLGLDLRLSKLCQYETSADMLAQKICRGRTMESIVPLCEKDVKAILEMCE